MGPCTSILNIRSTGISTSTFVRKINKRPDLGTRSMDKTDLGNAEMSKLLANPSYVLILVAAYYVQ